MEKLSIYLNDHLAGAIAGLELFEHLAASREGTPLAQLLLDVKGEIEADRAELESIIARLHERDRTIRKAVGWVSERLLRLKLRADDPHNEGLRLFESLEALVLGIEGKAALWRALAALPGNPRVLQGIDLARLIARAEQQSAALEPARLDAAKAAFLS